MNSTPQTIEQILSGWGRGQQTLPNGHETLKNSLLANFTVSPTAAQTVKPRRAFSGMPWLSLTFAALAVLAFIVLSPENRGLVKTQSSLNRSFQMDPSAGMTSSQGLGHSAMDEIAPQATMKVAPPLYPVPTPEVPSADNREFLKTDYSATMRSRQVADLTERLQTTVRGFGGRIDSSNSSEKYGYVTFVVPAGRFDGFRNEVKTFVGARFLTEETSTENLLPKKRGIENQQTEIKKLLDQLNADRDQLTNMHNKTVAVIQGQINTINKQLETVQDENQKQALLNQNRALKARLSDENAKYADGLNSINLQIKNSQNQLDNTNQQNSDLLDSVATVRGTISITWISRWDVLLTYVPLQYLVGIFLLLLAAISYLINRSKSKFILN